MSKDKNNSEVEVDKLAGINIDEFSKDAFNAMGINVDIHLARTYIEFKMLRDRLQPCRLNPSDLATIVMLAKKGS